MDGVAIVADSTPSMRADPGRHRTYHLLGSHPATLHKGPNGVKCWAHLRTGDTEAMVTS